MSFKIAINGYGRIGRNILRALYDMGYRDELQIVAINDLADVKTNAHLTRYDTVHGKFSKEVSVQGEDIVIDGDKIRILAQRDPESLPWKDLNVDAVLECTGFYTSREAASKHINAGARKVIISAPAGKDVDATIVYGINHDKLKANDQIISNASCTTNCLAPMVKPLHEKIGVVEGLMTTMHSYTNDQKLIDVYHSDIRRARAASQSMIPTNTGAAAAVGLVFPELSGKLDGFAVRVPTINVSLVDLTFRSARPTHVKEVNDIMKSAAENELKGILDYTEEELVSVDYNHTPVSCTFDATLTRVIGDTVKVLGWYDNEWGFSNRMLDTTLALLKAE